MRSTRDNPTLSLHTTITRGGAVSGATVRVALKRNDVADSFLDFGSSPKTFKISGWTNQFLALTEATNFAGFYEELLDMSLDLTLPAAVNSVIPLFEITAPAESVAVWAGEEIFFDTKVDAVSTENLQTNLFYAVAAISGSRTVPLGAVSHAAIEMRTEGGAFIGTPNWYVWFSYAAGGNADSAAGSSTVMSAAPTDGTFTTVATPS